MIPLSKSPLTDNGPHYHNSAVLMYLAEVNSVFSLKLVEHNFFEAGKSQRVLDLHLLMFPTSWWAGYELEMRSIG